MTKSLLLMRIANVKNLNRLQICLIFVQELTSTKDVEICLRILTNLSRIQNERYGQWQKNVKES